MAEPLWIYGAGGFGREVWFLLKSLSSQFIVEGFIDNHASIESLFKLPVLKQIGSNQKSIVAIADCVVRKEIVRKERIESVNLISPDIDISCTTFGIGNIICKGNILTTDVEIGNYVIINLACTVGHDVKISNFVSIMPGAHISGNVKIEEGVLIGTGAVILPGVKIGAWSKIGAGSVVTKDVEPGSVVVGTPGRCVKKLRYAE